MEASVSGAGANGSKPGVFKASDIRSLLNDAKASASSSDARPAGSGTRPAGANPKGPNTANTSGNSNGSHEPPKPL